VRVNLLSKTLRATALQRSQYPHLLLLLLLQNPPVADADFAERMSTSLMTWVHCWSSDADLDQLNRGNSTDHIL
jgi:hypothetical protein